MPSSGTRCARFPRVQNNVRYYIKLEDLKDQLKGIAPNTKVQEVQYTFDLQLAQAIDPQYREGLSFDGVPNGQGMTQSFADQIPDFGAGLTWEEEGSGA